MQIVHVGKCMTLSYEENRDIKRTQSDPLNELQTNRILLQNGTVVGHLPY